MKSRKIIYSLAFLWFSLDQVTKWWAESYLAQEPPIEVIGSLLKLNYTTNSGAAFNLGSNLTIVLTVFAMVVTVGLVILASKIAHQVWAIAIGTLLGGVLGNLSDRIFREPRFLHGHVVDFIQLPRWPIFNFADIAITVSGAILAILIFRNVEPFITFGQRRDEETL